MRYAIIAMMALTVFAACGPQTIGGDKDEHGCLIAAGYSWCEAKQECIRPWEEPCEEAYICPESVGDVCTMQYDPVCGYKNGESQTYSNPCVACQAGIDEYTWGEC